MQRIKTFGDENCKDYIDKDDFIEFRTNPSESMIFKTKVHKKFFSHDYANQVPSLSNRVLSETLLNSKSNKNSTDMNFNMNIKQQFSTGVENKSLTFLTNVNPNMTSNNGFPSNNTLYHQTMRENSEVALLLKNPIESNVGKSVNFCKKIWDDNRKLRLFNESNTIYSSDMCIPRIGNINNHSPCKTKKVNSVNKNKLIILKTSRSQNSNMASKNLIIDNKVQLEARRNLRKELKIDYDDSYVIERKKYLETEEGIDKLKKEGIVSSYVIKMIKEIKGMRKGNHILAYLSKNIK